MCEEQFDVVDELDRVLEQLPRSVVHSRRLLHRAVHIFVQRSDQRLLIHKRTEDKVEFPGVWTSSASGHVAAGEGYDAAARRELLEELGLDTAVTRLHKFPPSESTCREHTVLYSARTDAEPTPDPREMTAVRWLTPDEITHEISQSPEQFSPAFRLLFAWHQARTDPQ